MYTILDSANNNRITAITTQNKEIIGNIGNIYQLKHKTKLIV